MDFTIDLEVSNKHLIYAVIQFNVKILFSKRNWDSHQFVNDNVPIYAPKSFQWSDIDFFVYHAIIAVPLLAWINIKHFAVTHRSCRTIIPSISSRHYWLLQHRFAIKLVNLSVLKHTNIFAIAFVFIFEISNLNECQLIRVRVLHTQINTWRCISNEIFVYSYKRFGNSKASKFKSLHCSIAF